MSVSITILGAKEAIKILERIKNKSQTEIDKTLQKAAFFIHGEVKSSIAGHRAEPTSVDTGRFLNSVDAVTLNKEAIVFSDIFYAKFLEYGTSNINPRLHFRNSANRSKQKVREILRESAKDIIK